IPAKIVNANIVDPMLIMGTTDFADRYASEGADAFAAFEEENGRKFEFGTFPPGSVPDITLRYWLIEELGLEPGTDVKVTPLGGAGPVRQALLSGQIDGTSMIEPVPTIAKRRNAGYTDLDWSGNFFPGGQPGAVALMHERVYEDAPDVAEAFVESTSGRRSSSNRTPTGRHRRRATSSVRSRCPSRTPARRSTRRRRTSSRTPTPSRAGRPSSPSGRSASTRRARR
ncbi:MAG: ABC transporter substrate-binding protein, partial [Halobacteriales archaeon]